MKEKWVHLTTQDLKQVLAQDEIDKLQSISVADIDDVLQTQLDSVADSFRASFQAKGYTTDARQHYLPNAYRMYALALARYFIWTRFPNSKDIALDEPRKELFTTAQELLKSPYLATPEPDYSDDPTLSGDTSLTAYQDAALTLPFQMILPQLGGYGFIHPYTEDYQFSISSSL